MSSTEEIKSSLIIALKTEMIVQCWEQQQVADLCGVSKQYISGVLKGKSTIDKIISIMLNVGMNINFTIEDRDGNKS
jgi:predicted XRE-type DNA-binding protein